MLHHMPAAGNNAANLALFQQASQNGVAHTIASQGKNLNPQELARLGRLGDTQLAHVTPGEVVVPPSVQTPQLMQLLAQAFQAKGIPPQMQVVGSPQQSVNPATGIPEHFDFGGILQPVLGIGGAIAGGLIGGPPGAAIGYGLGNFAGGAIRGQPMTQNLMSSGIGALGSYFGGQAMGSMMGPGMGAQGSGMADSTAMAEGATQNALMDPTILGQGYNPATALTYQGIPVTNTTMPTSALQSGDAAFSPAFSSGASNPFGGAAASSSVNAPFGATTSPLALASQANLANAANSATSSNPLGSLGNTISNGAQNLKNYILGTPQPTQAAPAVSASQQQANAWASQGVSPTALMQAGMLPPTGVNSGSYPLNAPGVRLGSAIGGGLGTMLGSSLFAPSPTGGPYVPPGFNTPLPGLGSLKPVQQQLGQDQTKGQVPTFNNYNPYNTGSASGYNFYPIPG